MLNSIHYLVFKDKTNLEIKLVQPLLSFFKSLDPERIRTASPPELIFLCGGNGSDTSHFRPQLINALNQKGHKVELAENVLDWEGGKNFSRDLLELERYYSALVSIIPLVCESFGSAAELGAFVADEAIRNKLYIIIQEQFYIGVKSNSFIRHGPIKNYEDNEGRKVFCISNNASDYHLHVEEACKEIIDCRPATAKCNFEKGYFRILLVADIINMMVVSDDNEIKNEFRSALETFGIQPHKDDTTQYKEMLFILEKLKIIKKRSSGNKTYYICIRNNFYLDYRAKSATDYKKISTVRKEILNNLYKNKTIKTRILNEEKNTGDIEWLKPSSHLNKEEETQLLKTAPMQYKVFDIPKKNGGKRTIAQPTTKLKDIQREKISSLEAKLPIHENAKAYIKNTNGILSNALIHKDNSFFYKYDLKNFFPSIKASHFNALLEKNGFSLSERLEYIRIFFRFDKNVGKAKTAHAYRILKGSSADAKLLDFFTKDFENEFQLSVGAPSSPAISNMIMYEFDCKMSEYANGMGINYSRYADDITLSSNDKSLEIIIQSMLPSILLLTAAFLEINEKKERKLSLKNNVNITGLNITSEHKISIGREKKKKISAMIHHYTLGTLSDEKTQYLRGMLSFCKAVEKTFVESMEKKYSSEVISNILINSHFKVS